MPGCAPETQRKIRTAGFVISILISVGFFAAVFIIQNQRKNEVLTDEDRINRGKTTMHMPMIFFFKIWEQQQKSPISPMCKVNISSFHTLGYRS